MYFNLHGLVEIYKIRMVNDADQNPLCEPIEVASHHELLCRIYLYNIMCTSYLSRQCAAGLFGEAKRLELPHERCSSNRRAADVRIIIFIRSYMRICMYIIWGVLRAFYLYLLCPPAIVIGISYLA
jgi:hypothetical protein